MSIGGFLIGFLFSFFSSLSFWRQSLIQDLIAANENPNATASKRKKDSFTFATIGLRNIRHNTKTKSNKPKDLSGKVHLELKYRFLLLSYK